MADVSLIDRLRRAEAILRQSGDPVSLAVVDDPRMHVHEGVARPHALGLVRYHGGGSYALMERQADRIGFCGSFTAILPAMLHGSGRGG